jgi:hypothetical protein
MMNVKFVRVKVTKSEFFSFFFLFRKFLTSSCLFFLFCAPDKSKKGAVQKKKKVYF